MDKKRVLFISQEITPYLSETEISTRCRNLPEGIMEKVKILEYLCLSTAVLMREEINYMKLSVYLV